MRTIKGLIRVGQLVVMVLIIAWQIWARLFGGGK
jgi:hypothetical protein